MSHHHPLPILIAEACDASAGPRHICATCAYCGACLTHQHASAAPLAAALGGPQDLFDRAIDDGELVTCPSAAGPLVERANLLRFIGQKLTAAYGYRVDVLGFILRTGEAAGSASGSAIVDQRHERAGGIR